MSIEQTNVVASLVSTERASGVVVLTISDHPDWPDSTGHQGLLQAKLNRYLAFVESGEILEGYPGAKGRPIVSGLFSSSRRTMGAVSSWPECGR